MFDAKSLFDLLVKGAGQPAPASQPAPGGGPGGGMGGLGDLLGQVLGGAPSGAPGGGSGGRAAPGGGGLEDLLRNMVPGGQGAPSGGAQGGVPGGAGGLEDILRRLGGGAAPESAPSRRAAAPEPQYENEPEPLPRGGRSAPAGGAEDGGLADVLRRLQEQGGQGAGGLADILKQVLGQAGAGVKEGAGKISDATGAGAALDKVTGGKSADDILGQLKDLIGKNQLGAGAALGGLGALVLGTKTGRSAAVSAAKLGGLVLVGGLAYKAWQNYQNGRPLVTGPNALVAPPAGSGFEANAITNDTAILYIRAMIAGAAADGRLDAQEQQKLLGGLQQAGLEAEAEAFLRKELQNPASIDELVQGVQTGEQAVQLYTAARFAIEPDTDEEVEFLAALAGRLGMDKDLVAHIEAGARNIA